ncbi:MAG TPA: glycosyltransferase family 9 protein [Patescibacteria group bacterium]|nr:glycosyltransferase family 9 protein [Patescibacteria group bacterium]
MKVLVIQIAAAGDFLMATPALRALKRADGVAAVILLTGDSQRELVQGNPSLDRVFYLNDRRPFRCASIRRTAGMIRMALRLRREKFALGLNFQRHHRRHFILFLAGCKKRIGFIGRRGSLFLTDAVGIEDGKHHVFQYCDLLKGLGIFCLDFKLEFPLSQADLAAAAEKFLKPESLDEYVVIAPGGAAHSERTMETRRWPAANFAALAGLLARDGQRVVLLGSKDDVPLSASIKAAQPQVVDWTGKTTLGEAAALMKRARLVVCNDSGPLHLADAAGARVIAIFGPSHPGESKPLSAGNIAVWKGEDMECSPCCRDGIFPGCNQVSCLRKITPQEIFDLITK